MTKKVGLSYLHLMIVQECSFHMNYTLEHGVHVDDIVFHVFILFSFTFNKIRRDLHDPILLSKKVGLSIYQLAF